MGNSLSSCFSSCVDDEFIDTLPPIVFYSFAELKRLGRTPRSPQDKHRQIRYDKIHRNISLLIFYSHCWLRGWPGAKDYNVVVDPLTEPKPHPDTPNHDKFQLLLKACEWIKMAYGPDIDDENIYIWFDYGCIDQDAAACDELKMLDKIMGVCDMMLTTIYDENWTREWNDKLTANGISDIFKEYGSPAWNQGDHSYLKRAWCLVEMMYASNVPLVESSPERLSMFRGVLLKCIEEDRRPHLLMGTNELKLNMPPVVLPPLRDKYFIENDPRNGKLTVEGDRVKIGGLVGNLKIKISEEKYEGERNEKMQYHGEGTYTYAEGSKYQGEWKDDKMHGEGTFTFADGDKYQGELKDDKMHGKGIMTSADGSIIHNGEWRDGKPVGKSYPKDQCGWITKKGHVYPSWKKRYFRLRYGLLEYYTEESCAAKCLKGSVNVSGYTIDASTPLEMYVSDSSKSSGKNMHLRFENEGDREQWLKALQGSV